MLLYAAFRFFYAAAVVVTACDGDGEGMDGFHIQQLHFFNLISGFHLYFSLLPAAQRSLYEVSDAYAK